MIEEKYIKKYNTLGYWIVGKTVDLSKIEECPRLNKYKIKHKLCFYINPLMWAKTFDITTLKFDKIDKCFDNKTNCQYYDIQSKKTLFYYSPELLKYPTNNSIFHFYPKSTEFLGLFSSNLYEYNKDSVFYINEYIVKNEFKAVYLEEQKFDKYCNQSILTWMKIFVPAIFPETIDEKTREKYEEYSFNDFITKYFSEKNTEIMKVPVLKICDNPSDVLILKNIYKINISELLKHYYFVWKSHINKATEYMPSIIHNFKYGSELTNIGEMKPVIYDVNLDNNKFDFDIPIKSEFKFKEKIGSGSYGNVYKINKKLVAKEFHLSGEHKIENSCFNNLDNIKREIYISKLAGDNNVSPKVHDYFKIDDNI